VENFNTHRGEKGREEGRKGGRERKRERERERDHHGKVTNQ